MKSLLKKMTVFLCVTAMLFSFVNVQAVKDKKTENDTKQSQKEENIPLYEKYGYQEEFKYEDEIIAHALKSSVAKILVEYDARLRYSPMIFDDDKFNEWKNSFLENKEREAAESSEESYEDEQERQEKIKEEMMVYLKQNMKGFISYSSPKTVNAGGSWMGSGVVISDDGYVATNAHVATLSKDDKAMMYAESIDSGVMSDWETLISDLSDAGIELTNSESYDLYMELADSAAQKLEVIEEDLNLLVCFPTKDGDTAADKATAYDAKVVEEGTAVGEGIEGQTEDVAILKIEADNLVSLKLSDSYPEVNSKVVSAGFPAASDEGFVNMGSTESVLSVTVGTGQVARLVPIEGTKLKAIEITTTISGGNSGGPSVDANLNIEGLNTYTLNADNRYAYMVPAEYVAELSKKFDIEQGEATLTFLTGLQMLQQGYGASALACFERVEELQGETPYIEHLEKLAKKQPQKELEKAPEETPKEKKDSAKTTKSFPMLIIIAVAAVVLIVIIVVTCLIIKSKKKKARMEAIPRTPPTPIPGSVQNIPPHIPGAVPPGGNVAPAHTAHNAQVYNGVGSPQVQNHAGTAINGNMNPMAQSSHMGAAPAVSPEVVSAPPKRPGLKSTMRTKPTESSFAPAPKKSESSAAEHPAFKQASSDLDDN